MAGNPTDTTTQFVNREISWLSFNERVLQEAADASVPLIERLKFMGIFSNNLDEFFRVRVGTMQRLAENNIRDKSLIESSPKKTLAAIHDVVMRQREEFDRVFNELMQELEAHKIYIINETQLDGAQTEFVQQYLNHHVRSALVPIMLKGLDTFPYLKNQVVYLACHLTKSASNKAPQYALIEVPADILPRFVVLPSQGDRHFVIMLDDIIRFGLREIFKNFDYDQMSAYTVKMTRDAEIDVDDDVTSSLFEKIAKSVRQRRSGSPVRFVYDREMPGDLLNYVLAHNNLTDFENVIPGGRYHNARDFIGFPRVGGASLEYRERLPVTHPVLESSRSLLNAVRDQDVLLHFPYQSYDYVIDMLREAAIDPKVKSIKMTVYRVAKNSKILNALLNAVRNGKQVTVMMELQARFDEERNIRWTRQLEDEDAKVVASIPGLKVHSKICLITRKENKALRHYAMVGTGNFNETTARIYTDHTLITANRKITREVARVFDFLENPYNSTQGYKHLIVSPFYMRKKWTRLIRDEIAIAKAGRPAYIHAKLNNLVDRKMIQRLYEASQAGVKIKLIVRGICSLVPGVPGLSENIEVISIVDKYLEHSRVIVFGNDGDEKVYLSSADWMVRNLDNRVEVASPVYDEGIKRELRAYLDLQFQDSTKARIVDPEQVNNYRRAEGNGRAQNDIYEFLLQHFSEGPAKERRHG